MKLTEKLLGNLNRVFNKDPKHFLALRFRHASVMTWTVSEMRLKTAVASGVALDIDLTAHTLGTLAAYISTQTGYTVDYIDASRSSLSARLLLDDSGNPANSNGDHLYGYTSLIWAFLEAFAAELAYAGVQAEEAPQQLAVPTADGMWLDEIGGYYGVPRGTGEIDALYGPRIIAETLRPRANNVALASAIEVYTGQAVDVADVVAISGGTHFYDGTYTHNSAITYDTATTSQYALFDVVYGYDVISGGSFAAFQAAVKAIVNRLRAAGTHLRTLTLASPAIGETYPNPILDAMSVLAFTMALADTVTAPTDTFAPMAAVTKLTDDVTEPTEGSTLTIVDGHTYSGVYRYDGSFFHTGGTSPTTTLEGV